MENNRYPKKTNIPTNREAWGALFGLSKGVGLLVSWIIGIVVTGLLIVTVPVIGTIFGVIALAYLLNSTFEDLKR